MIPLILTILFVHVAVHIVNTIGATTIDTLLWLIYLKFPTSTSAEAREQNRLKREVLQLKYDMNNTSSQDEFAKWAKLRRRHDKSLEEFETMNKSLVSQKTSFEWTVKIARWISTTGLRLFLQFYYAKTPVFVLPSGWFPYYIEWILAFPRAPLGSVSVQIWSGVCTAAIALIADMITSIYLLATSGVTGLLATGKTASEARAKKAQ